MADKQTGGPAFPCETTNGHVYFSHETQRNEFLMESHPGMTIRDYFAAKAMASYLMPAGPGNTWANRDDLPYIAEMAYLAADAMLKARDA